MIRGTLSLPRPIMTSPRILEGALVAGRARIAIAAARYNDFIVESLIEGALAAWAAHGGASEALDVVRVPGAFELPAVARKLVAVDRYDAIVALGCVIRGGTPHFEYVAGECARGLMQLSLESGVPIVFGVLTCDTVDQAIERAAVRAGNKGGEALEAALEMVDLFTVIEA
jgi:6,7-dimethyl-8-ribityllumazine synthase